MLQPQGRPGLHNEWSCPLTLMEFTREACFSFTPAIAASLIYYGNGGGGGDDDDDEASFLSSLSA